LSLAGAGLSNYKILIVLAGDDGSILSRLWKHSQEDKTDRLDHLDIASECADHFLAGIDTTSDTLMFLVWALSLPGSAKFQEKLREEVLGLPEEALIQTGTPRAAESDKCTYLNAVIKETLRLYAPLPSYEPRSLDIDSEIDGFPIPAHTVVGMSPFSLHRNPAIFHDPLEFNPDRWMGPDAKELNRWFWAFSSGGRMCIGMQYVSSLFQTYRKYSILSLTDRIALPWPR
jgi:cytochrome P450